jgi:hypothetical protein
MSSRSAAARATGPAHDEALTRAWGHGLIWKSSLKSFAALALEISPNFDDKLGAELVPPGDGGGRGRIALIYQLQKAT